MKSFLVFVAAFTLIAVAAPAQEGLDNAADAAYDAGWNYGDNGGSGFNAWIFNSLYDVTFATDATTAGGEGVMNTGGRCFQVRFDPGLGSVNASIYRTISTSGNTSDVLRLDIQSILTGESTVVADFYGGGNRIGYLIGVGNVANYTMEDGGGATDTGT